MRGLCIDMGTGVTNISALNKGEMFNNASMVTLDCEDNIITDAGNESKQALGKTPENLTVIKPLSGGVIADYSAAEGMVKMLMKKIFKRTVFTSVNALVSIPSNTTQMERRAAGECVKSLGVANVWTVESPIAAAIGAGMNVLTPRGNMVIDIGSGTADVAIIALANIATGVCVKDAGDSMDSAIVSFVKRRYNVLIGENTAERIKIEMGSAISKEKNEIKKYKGRDLFSGLPKEFGISNEEVCSVISPVLEKISEAVTAAFEKTPPELLSNVMEAGIVITGGLANLYGIDEFITAKTGFKAQVAENPSGCILRGMEKIFTDKKLKHIKCNA